MSTYRGSILSLAADLTLPVFSGGSDHCITVLGHSRACLFVYLYFSVPVVGVGSRNVSVRAAQSGRTRCQRVGPHHWRRTAVQRRCEWRDQSSFLLCASILSSFYHACVVCIVLVVVFVCASRVQVWDPSSLRCIRTLQEHIGQISQLVVHKDMLIAASWDRTLRVRRFSVLFVLFLFLTQCAYADLGS